MTILSTLTKVAPLAIAAALAAAPASAADLYTKAPRAVAVVEQSMFDIAFGALVQSDYNFRGISQSDKHIGGAVYFEPRYKFGNFEAYVGIGVLSTKLPTAPTAEVDLYGGLRYTMGTVTLDVGGIYYYYPNETQQFCVDAGCTALSATNFGNGFFTLRNTDFAEVYGKLNWAVNDQLALGAYVYYSDNWLNTGASGLYAGGTAKYTIPSSYFANGWGAYISGEVAHYWLGNTSSFGAANFNIPDYMYWNAGIAFTYKAMTLDLRYHDTDLTRAQCFTVTGDPRGVTNGSGRSSWCGETFIAKLSIDTTLAAIK